MIEANSAKQPALLRIENLHVRFSGPGRFLRQSSAVHAVSGVSLSVAGGETLGLVGESGSGKSTLIRSIVGLSPVSAGRIMYDGIDVLTARGGQRRRLQRDIQLVSQDASGSLNPRMRVEQIVTEPLVIHGLIRRSHVRAKATELLAHVGLEATALPRYPHEFSGGQRQRIGIARGLALKPRLILLDEPVSALDVSVQAQILGMLRRLQQELELTYIFVGHNLAVVGRFCQRIAVMHRGRMVETGPAENVVKAPQHEYTAKLLEAIPGGARICGVTAPQPRTASVAAR